MLERRSPWALALVVTLIPVVGACGEPEGPAVQQAPADSNGKATASAARTPSPNPSADQTAASTLPAAPSAGARDRFPDESVILEPSPARPVILSPGDSFYCLLHVSNKLGKSAFIRLVNADVPAIEVSLRHATPLAVTRAERHGAVVLEVPTNAPDGLYDLVIKGENELVVGRHCVNIVSDFKSRFRFVHLSDMNIGDPAAPRFDEMLVDEINLLAPAFIVATGDYREWAYTLDQPREWKKILNFFARFDAPVYLACGDRDHDEGFTTFVANSLVGSFSYGSYHGILLFDHSRRPIDDEQIKWLRKDLQEHRDATFNFIVTHDDSLAFLDGLADELPDAARFLADHRVKMVIAGGHADWDEQEYRDKLAPFEGLHYIRTHQASTSLRGRATGVSHYRVIEVQGESVHYIYKDADAKPQQSIAVGRLRTFYDRPNDGSSTTVVAIVQNSLNQVFEDCRLKLRVAKKPGDKDAAPLVAGGTLLRTLDAGSHWLCEVRVDLPDKGGLRVMATTQEKIPEAVAFDIKLDGQTKVVLNQATTEQGLKYFSSADPLRVVLTNPTDHAVKGWPVIRVDGNLVPIKKDSLALWPVELEAGGKVTLPLEFRVSHADPGPHLLQVYFLEDPLRRITTFPITIELGT